MKQQPFWGVVPKKKWYVALESSGSGFCRQTNFAICCSYIKSTDYGVNENMSLSKDLCCCSQPADKRRKDTRKNASP